MGYWSDKYMGKYIIKNEKNMNIAKITEEINSSEVITIDEGLIRKIKSTIYIGKYLVEYEYETMRKNKKNNRKIVVQTSAENAEKDFWLWLNNTNEKEPLRRISNVKILGINVIGEAKVEL